MSEKPTPREIAAVSSDPKRFKRCYPMAREVATYAASHGGQLPAFVHELDEQRFDELAETLRELDDWHWVRRMVAA